MPDRMTDDISNFPLVSVIVPVYNAEKYLAATLDSICSQVYTNIEVIVVNDGSVDASQSIIDQYKDKGVIAIIQENKGATASYNAGFKKSTGEFIKFIDQDDLINNSMIPVQVEALLKNPGKVAYSRWDRFFNDDPATASFPERNYYRDMAPIDFLTADEAGVMLQCGSMMMTRKQVEAAGLWDERLILFNDTEFFTRVILQSSGIVFTREAKLYYRSGMTGSLSRGRARKYYESSFLGTELIAGHMLAKEDSPRVRRLISNTYLMQRYSMFPLYEDLAKQHEEKAAWYGYGDLKVRSGKLYNILVYLLGWKSASRIKHFTQQLFSK